MLTDIEEQAKRDADNYLVTDALLEAKDKEIAELKYKLEISRNIRKILLRDTDNLRAYCRNTSVERDSAMNCLDWVVTDRDMLRTNTARLLMSKGGFG